MEVGLTTVGLRKEFQMERTNRKPPDIGKPERVIKVPRPPVPQTEPPKPTPGP